MAEATEKALEKATAEGIDLDEVAGSGENGRITVEDVDKAIAEKREAEDAAAGAGDDEDEVELVDPMPERAHKINCPRNVERIETYEVRANAKTDSNGIVVAPARMVTMAHCVDCGSTYQLTD